MIGIKRTKPRRGFTLIELAIVIAAIAVLMGVVAHFARSYTMESRATKIAEWIKKIDQASMQFYQDTGGLPKTNRPLYQNADFNGNPIPGWNGPYLVVREHINDQYGDIPLHIDDMYLLIASSYCGVDANAGTTAWAINIFKFSGTIDQRLLERVDAIVDDGNLSSGRCKYYTNFCGNRPALMCFFYKKNELPDWKVY